VNETLHSEIHKLTNSIWNKEELHSQWKEPITVPVYKRADKTDCCNYQVDITWRRVQFMKLLIMELNILLSNLFSNTLTLCSSLTVRDSTEFLSWARSIQSTAPHSIFLRSVLIISSHLYLGLHSGHSLAFAPKPYMHGSSAQCMMLLIMHMVMNPSIKCWEILE
jgi:hypothetical protein